jgi:hypothetical protein
VKQDVKQQSVVASSTTTDLQGEVNTSTESSSVSQTTLHEQTNDSSETVVIRETTWFDTSRTDSNGVSPVLRKERVTSLTRHGKRSDKGSEDKSNTEGRQKNSATIKNSAKTEESAASENRSETKKDTSTSETKQVAYLSWLLFGLAFCILMAVLAYWVFTKYRQRR